MKIRSIEFGIEHHHRQSRNALQKWHEIEFSSGMGVATGGHKNHRIKTLDARWWCHWLAKDHEQPFVILAQWPVQWGPVFAHAYDVLWEKSGNVCFIPVFPPFSGI